MMKQIAKLVICCGLLASALGTSACEQKKAEAPAPVPTVQTAAPAPSEAKIEAKTDAAPLTCDDGSICPVE